MRLDRRWDIERLGVRSEGENVSASFSFMSIVRFTPEASLILLRL